MRPVEWRRRGGGLALCILCSLPAAGQGEREVRGRAEDTSDVVAEVGDEVITAQEVAEAMRLRGGDIEGQYRTLEQKKALLEQLVLHEALVAEAERRGYERDPEIVEVVERAMVGKLLRDVLDERLALVSVTDAEVEAFYASHQEEYARPARYGGAVVFVEVSGGASPDERAARRARAEEALSAARALEPGARHFGPVARQYSDDRASRYMGGSIGWLVRHPGQEYRWPQAVTEAIFDLDSPGQLGPLVETEEGFWLVKLTDLEPAAARPLDALREGIRARLVKERKDTIREEFVASVLSAADIGIDEARLDAVQPPPPARRSGPPDAPPSPPELPKGEGQR